jgi:hypothetical protein
MTQPRLLDAEQRAFLVSGVSVIVAARGDDRTPTLMRGHGVRLARDGERVVVLLAESQAHPVLRAIGRNGAIAAVFCQPSTHRTIQLKGTDALIAPSVPGDRALVAAYREALADDLVRLGYGRDHAFAMLTADPSDLVAVEFTPNAAFVATPGPSAGAPLRAGQ